MSFSYLTESDMQELWPVGCRVKLKSLGSRTYILTITPHAESASPYDMRFSTTLKSGPAVNIRYPKSRAGNAGGWVFVTALRLIGKCANGTCSHRSA